MRSPRFGLQSLFYLALVCGSLLKAGQVFGFLNAMVVISIAIVACCAWYFCISRAPTPTVHATVLLVILSPLFVMAVISITRFRESTRSAGSVESVRNLATQYAVDHEYYPERRTNAKR